MIELKSEQLVFSFPTVSNHLSERVRGWVDNRLSQAATAEKARLPGGEELYRAFEHQMPKIAASVYFQRTLRIPDDGKDYPLPPGLGLFPVRHVDDFPAAPDAWKRRGGVMLPMHKTEALWLRFASDYPMALKVGAGGICAISGEKWSTSLNAAPQNYVVLPFQPWIDGFRVSEGTIRQFVAVPLGKGLTVEHQVTGEETWGGLQLQAFPMSFGRFWHDTMVRKLEWTWSDLVQPDVANEIHGLPLARAMGVQQCATSSSACLDSSVGLGAGGRMKQKITRDPLGVDAWDSTQTSRCFAHLCLSEDWQRITGEQPPPPPRAATDYTNAGGAWFDYEGDEPAVADGTVLSGIKSVGDLLGEKTGFDLPDNTSVTPKHVVAIKHTRTVREF